MATLKQLTNKEYVSLFRNRAKVRATFEGFKHNVMVHCRLKGLVPPSMDVIRFIWGNFNNSIAGVKRLGN